MSVYVISEQIISEQITSNDVITSRKPNSQSVKGLLFTETLIIMGGGNLSISVSYSTSWCLYNRILLFSNIPLIIFYKCLNAKMVWLNIFRWPTYLFSPQYGLQCAYQVHGPGASRFGVGPIRGCVWTLTTLNSGLGRSIPYSLDNGCMPPNSGSGLIRYT